MFPLPRLHGPPPPFLSPRPARPLPQPPSHRRAGTLCKCNLSGAPPPPGSRAPVARNAEALGAGRRPVHQPLTGSPVPRRPRARSLRRLRALAARSLFVPQPPRFPPEPGLSITPALLPALSFPAPRPPARWPYARFRSFPRRPESKRKERLIHPILRQTVGGLHGVPLATASPQPPRQL